MTHSSDEEFLKFCERQTELGDPCLSRDAVARLRKLAGAPPLLEGAPETIVLRQHNAEVLIANARFRLTTATI